MKSPILFSIGNSAGLIALNGVNILLKCSVAIGSPTFGCFV